MDHFSQQQELIPLIQLEQRKDEASEIGQEMLLFYMEHINRRNRMVDITQISGTDQLYFDKSNVSLVEKADEIIQMYKETLFVREYKNKSLKKALEKFCEWRNEKRNWVFSKIEMNHPDFRLLPAYQAALLRLFMALVRFSETENISAEVWIQLDIMGSILRLHYFDSANEDSEVNEEIVEIAEHLLPFQPVRLTGGIFSLDVPIVRQEFQAEIFEKQQI